MRLKKHSLMLIAFALLPGCGGSSTTVNQGTPTSDETSLFLMGALNMDAAGCRATADKGAPMLGGGVLDLALTSSYTANLLLENQLPRPGSVETERASLQGAEITLTSLDGTRLEKYSTIGVGFVAAATASAAYGTMSLDLIPTEFGSKDSVQSANQLVAKIRVLAEALNGTKLTSNELAFPIRVCTGCLVQYPASAYDPGVRDRYLCVMGEYAQARAMKPCVLGQDVPFSCVLCSEDNRICRDPALNPSLE